MNQAQLRQQFYSQLSKTYLQGELQALYHWCVQEIHGWSRVEAYMHNTDYILESELNTWKSVIARLLKEEPIQYIFESTEFHGLTLVCNRDALIPRPETEELVDLVLSQELSTSLSALDVGCGTGCISLALKKHRPKWSIRGVDVSTDAVALAKRNALNTQLDVDFTYGDVSSSLDLNEIDIIVSNPPYIPNSLRHKLSRRVVKNEPEIALFSPADNPFYFFKQITLLAAKAEVRSLFFETHATSISALMEELSKIWTGIIESKNDLSGKPRFLVLTHV